MTDHRLAPEQLRFFETFGFLAFPGLLGDCIDEIIEAFEAVWAGRGGGHHGAPHDGEQRSCIVPFIDQHPRLCALLDDARIEGLLSSLIGADFNYVGSDGNYYAGDTRWHSDGWGRRLRFVKVALYLDPLTRDSGCLRVIPGSHHLEDGFAGTVQEHIREIPETWGVEARDLPCLPLETEPGDVLVFNHNLKHAAFGGSARRRMFTINCSQRFPEEELPALREYIAVHARFWNRPRLRRHDGGDRREAPHGAPGAGARQRRPPRRAGRQGAGGDGRARPGLIRYPRTEGLARRASPQQVGTGPQCGTG